MKKRRSEEKGEEEEEVEKEPHLGVGASFTTASMMSDP
jgi:hypothetical protein